MCKSCRWICLHIHLSMNMCSKFQVVILESVWFLPFWMSEKATGYAMYVFWHCSIFKLCPIWVVQKFLGSISCFWRKSDLKTCTSPSKPKIDLFWPCDPGWLWYDIRSSSHQRLRRVLRIIPDTTHAVPSALYLFDSCSALRRQRRQIIKNITFDPTCDVISDLKIIFCNIFRKFKPGAIKCRFRIENRFDQSSSLADSKWVGAKRPPSSAGRIRKDPIGARVNFLLMKRGHHSW